MLLGGGARGIERYHVIEKVGEGTYGVVYKAMDLLEKRAVALKKIRLDLDEDGIPTTAIREVSLLKELKHKNIIRLIDVVHLPRSLYLVFDLVDTDLKQCMDAQVCGLSPATIQSYMQQLLSGIAYCHSHRVLHRDLKPQNLLIDRSSGLLRLADFGLSRTFRLPARSYTNEVVTLWYRSPEVLLGGPQCTTALDLWSAGCIFAEMITGKPLFTGESEIDQLFKTFRALGTPTPAAAPTLCSLPAFQSTFPKWRGEPLRQLLRGATRGGQSGLCPKEEELALSLLAGLLAYEPSQRLTAREALDHPYFRTVTKHAAAESPWQSQGATMSTPVPVHVPGPGAREDEVKQLRNSRKLARDEADGLVPEPQWHPEQSAGHGLGDGAGAGEVDMLCSEGAAEEEAEGSGFAQLEERRCAGAAEGRGMSAMDSMRFAFGQSSVDINAAAELLPTGNTPPQQPRTCTALEASQAAATLESVGGHLYPARNPPRGLSPPSLAPFVGL